MAKKLKGKWRTRTRGTPRQKGSKFQLSPSSQKLKAKLAKTVAAKRPYPKSASDYGGKSHRGIETLAIHLGNSCASQLMKQGYLRSDEAITKPEAMELAERIRLASTREEANAIFRTISKHTRHMTLEDGGNIASEIWDYGVDWKNAKWTKAHIDTEAKKFRIRKVGKQLSEEAAKEGGYYLDDFGHIKYSKTQKELNGESEKDEYGLTLSDHVGAAQQEIHDQAMSGEMRYGMGQDSGLVIREEAKKEKKEHPWATEKQAEQIAKDHLKKLPKAGQDFYAGRTHQGIGKKHRGMGAEEYTKRYGKAKG